MTSTDFSQGTVNDVSESKFVRASDSVSVWKNAAFPLRVNARASDGTVVENQRMTVLAEEQDAEVRLNKQRLAVFNPDEEIQMSFKSRAPITTRAFEGAEVQLLAVKVGPNASATLFGSDPSTNGLLGTLRNAEASGNVSAEIRDLGRLEDGAIATSYDVSESGPARGPGQYAFFVVQTTEGEGFTADDGSLSVDGRVRVLGADIAVVQAAQASASVTTENPTPGDAVRFDVDSTFTHSNVSHVVVLYNESQYAESWTRFTVTGPMNENLSADQVSVTSTIVGVNGTQNVTGTAKVGGVTIGDGVVEGETRVGSIADWVVDGAGGSSERETPGSRSGSWLDASVTAVSSGDGETTVAVQTEDDWADGTYRYVYLAQAKGASNLSTTTGTVELGADDDPEDGSDESSGGSDGGGDAGGSSGGGSGGGSAGPAEPAEPAEPASTVDIADGRADLEVGATISRLQVGFLAGGSGGSVTARELDARPESIPEIPNAEGFKYIDVTVPEDRTEGEATLRFDVDTETFGDVSPSDLVVHHYHDGEWSALDTNVVSTEGTVVTLEATTPGFSVFAIGTRAPSADSGSLSETETATGDTTEDDDDMSPPADVGTPTDDEPIQERGGFDTTLVAVVALFALLAGFFVYRRNR